MNIHIYTCAALSLRRAIQRSLLDKNLFHRALIDFSVPFMDFDRPVRFFFFVTSATGTQRIHLSHHLTLPVPHLAGMQCRIAAV